jgi:hypothetical protein
MSSSMGDYEMFKPATSGQRSLAPTSAFGAHRGNFAERTGQSSRSREASRQRQQYHQQTSDMVYRQPPQPPSYLEAMADNDAKPPPVHFPQRFNRHEHSSYDDEPGSPTSGRSGLSDARSAQTKQTAGIPSSSKLNRPTAAHFKPSDYSSTAGTHTPTQHSGPGGFPDRGHERVYVGRPSETAGGAAATSGTQKPNKIKSGTDTTGCKEFCCEIGCHACLGICQAFGEVIGALC